MARAVTEVPKEGVSIFPRDSSFTRKLFLHSCANPEHPFLLVSHNGMTYSGVRCKAWALHERESSDELRLS